MSKKHKVGYAPEEAKMNDNNRLATLARRSNCAFGISFEAYRLGLRAEEASKTAQIAGLSLALRNNLAKVVDLLQQIEKLAGNDSNRIFRKYRRLREIERIRSNANTKE